MNTEINRGDRYLHVKTGNEYIIEEIAHHQSNDPELDQKVLIIYSDEDNLYSRLESEFLFNADGSPRFTKIHTTHDESIDDDFERFMDGITSVLPSSDEINFQIGVQKLLRMSDKVLITNDQSLTTIQWHCESCKVDHSVVFNKITKEFIASDMDDEDIDNSINHLLST